MKSKRYIGALAVLALTAGTVVATQVAAVAATTVSINSHEHSLTGTNIKRAANALIMYTNLYGVRTGTNKYGTEAIIVNSKITKIVKGAGNSVIPPNGFVLSGHGTSATWLNKWAYVGAYVTFPVVNPPPSGTALYPDITVRTLRLFEVRMVGDKKMLFFPGVTANTGDGPFEVIATRPSSTSAVWTARQTIFYSNGSKQTIPNSLDFYYAGDGHSHWHMRDFDAYTLYNSAGTRIKEGEKHGFCFEDNTDYRDWPGSAAHPASPAVPVYTHDNVCGVGQPTTLKITHGLSVGWSDTYPTTLPDQAINITGISDGTYKVEILADSGNWLKESNETNNSSWARIQLTGDTVTILETGGGV